MCVAIEIEAVVVSLGIGHDGEGRGLTGCIERQPLAHLGGWQGAGRDRRERVRRCLGRTAAAASHHGGPEKHQKPAAMAHHQRILSTLEEPVQDRLS